ncbi:MAG: DUF523 and DUF1722 domain-containing protein [Spongiibacteraceae bacterium]
MDKSTIIASDNTVLDSGNQRAKGDLEGHSGGDFSTKLEVGLSACLAGQEVRYNGGHTQSKLCLELLGKHFNFNTFCPEVAAGFGTPRPTMRLVGNPENPTLQYSNDDKTDLTKQLTQGFVDKLPAFKTLDGYILMKNSPSCGLERVKVYQPSGYPDPVRGQGLFAAALKKQYPLMPIEEEGRLHDARLFENFVLRIYAYHNFRAEVLAEPSLHNLIQFHSSYKYILMAHHQPTYKKLGSVLGQAKKEHLKELIEYYFELFMQALAKPASKKNHTNTLLHILGYLKKSVPSEARINITEVIGKYHQGQLPLITPLTLLKHYLDQYGSEYIRHQRYLSPYPESLGLANHL